jgi:hypothetical protein
MLEKKGASFVGMATPALHVYGFMFDHCMALSSMRVVTTGAGYLALNYGMV